MIRVGILTCSDFPDLTLSDQKLIPLLKESGIFAEAVIWDNPLFQSTRYDVLLFRNTWDYFTKKETFFNWLNELTTRNITTINTLDTIFWNAHKFYLKELQEYGIPVIPGIFISKDDDTDFRMLIPEDWEKAVIKPAISAGAYLTECFFLQNVDTISTVYKDIRKSNDLIIQKFIPEIITHGEISLVFFDKKYSHAVIKTPKDGDFRIQSQFGGSYMPYFPDDLLLNSCTNIIQYIKHDLLYARIDGVMIGNVFHLMELELIEPDLYLDYVQDGHRRFTDVIVQYLQSSFSKEDINPIV
jgi:glutathione synthase/RimK-type ligase-like ATP-grasp enzyme